MYYVYFVLCQGSFLAKDMPPLLRLHASSGCIRNALTFPSKLSRNSKMLVKLKDSINFLLFSIGFYELSYDEPI